MNDLEYSSYANANKLIDLQGETGVVYERKKYYETLDKKKGETSSRSEIDSKQNQNLQSRTVRFPGHVLKELSVVIRM